ncbi:MAG: tRNA lysidine(34) synthetase TilS [Eubacteriaceae bacterium]|nr:tRNA lysidine(34) synthetase TilS [Eubacteriaceae bacterium]
MDKKLQQRIIDGLNKHNLIHKGEKVLAMVSGGPDSVFLLYALLAAQGQIGYSVEVFHMNHMLRPAAKEEEKLVQELCGNLGVVCHVAREDVAGYAKANSISLEEAGRLLRYSHAAGIAKNRGIAKIATGHHMDDLAETVLMRIIRGASVRGIIGIAPKRADGVIRPLLGFEKEEITGYLNASKIPYSIDETNSQNDYFRNRVRNTIIPLLKAENPSFAKAALGLSESALRDEEFISLAASQVPLLVEEKAAKANIDDLAGLHHAVLSRVVTRMLESVGAALDQSQFNITKVIDMLASSRTIWQIDVAGAVFRRSYGALEATRRQAGEQSSSQTMDTDDFYCPLLPGQTYFLPNFEYSIAVDIAKKTKKNQPNRFIWQFDYDKIRGKLVIRYKRAGDFFFPLGLGGKKTLKKFFIDKKIPIKDRAYVPIITDSQNIILVGNFSLDDRYKIEEGTQRVVQITFQDKNDSKISMM